MMRNKNNQPVEVSDYKAYCEYNYMTAKMKQLDSEKTITFSMMSEV